MSRESISNETYEFVYGLDHTTGPFFQILPREWPKVEGDEDPEDYGPIIAADNLGVRTNPMLDVPLVLKKRYYELMTQFRLAKANGNHHPNIAVEDIQSFANLCGLSLSYKDVAAVLDAPP